MLTNSQMIAGRFLRLHRARKAYRFITENLEAGRMVQITTRARATRFKRQHLGMFKVGRDGNLYVQRGKAWDCLLLGSIDIRAFA